jgi:gliding motility-associated lipoprotein GldD
MKNILLMLVFLLAGLWLVSCGNQEGSPRPRGYFRIDLPEKSWVSFDSSTYPYAFEYASLASLNTTITPDSEQYWLNIDYPSFGGTLHLSYKAVHGNLSDLLEDAHELANKHLAKATYMEPRPILRDSAGVYGLIYDIRGAGVASSVQFYLTDSLRHYVRGALYFNVAPNNDSLAPVIDYVKEDIDHLINSFHWR